MLLDPLPRSGQSPLWALSGPDGSMAEAAGPRLGYRCVLSKGLRRACVGWHPDATLGTVSWRRAGLPFLPSAPATLPVTDGHFLGSLSPPCASEVFLSASLLGQCLHRGHQLPWQCLAGSSQPCWGLGQSCQPWRTLFLPLKLTSGWPPGPPVAPQDSQHPAKVAVLHPLFSTLACLDSAAAWTLT